MRLRTFLAVALSVFVVFLFVTARPLHAQSTATLTGTITDQSGAAIAGVQVSAMPSGNARNFTRTATSDAEGHFSLTLEPGAYRVTITQASFETVIQDFRLSAGEKREWAPRLKLARLASSVVVSAQAEPEPADNVTAPVTVLTRQDAEQRDEIFIAPLLGSTPGATLARLGPLGGVTSFFLDGGNSNFTKVLVDGTPVNQPGGAIDFSNLTLENIDKIEIVHGATSALYGSDAIDGVIQIFTRRGTTKIPELGLTAEGGDFQTGRGSGDLSGLLGSFDYSLGAEYFSSNGQGPNDAFRDTTLSGNFGWRFSQHDNLRLSLRSNSSAAEQPGQTLLQPPILDQGTDLHNLSANLRWDFATGDHWQHHLAGFESDFRELTFGPFGSFPQSFNRAGFNEQSTYLFRNGGITGGYQYEVENGGQEGRHNQAGYLEARYQFGTRLSAIAGGRAEANGAFGTRVVPRVGVAYALRFGRDFWGATRLRASYGLGIKEPEALPSGCIPQLKPEQSRTVDVGIEQYLASNRLRFTVGYFDNNFRDIVSFAFGVPVPNCPAFGGSFFNTDEARARGVNTSFEAKPVTWLRIVGNYSYDDSKVLKAENFFDPTQAPGNRLFLRPLHSANLIANAHFLRMNWNVAGYFVGARTDSDFLGLGLTRAPSYLRWDLANSIALGHGLATIARVENLFDRHYQDAIGYPGLRLNYRLGMKYTWGGEGAAPYP
jgi:outer membrane cobalamin receptor